MLTNHSASTEHSRTSELSLLSVEELGQVHGGLVKGTVDGGQTTVALDDFGINMEIFKGNIKGPFIL